jgi:hypothetical protein
LLADGFSCRTQIHELDSGGREAMHLAELLAAAGTLPPDHPERAAALRPRPPGRGARIGATALAVGVPALAAAAGIAARLARRRR